jgi:hypothetical protein
MATLPNGAGGYQVGDGNLNEVQMNTQGTPATATVTATLTTAQLLNGIILGTPTTTAAAYTLPLATDLDAVVSSAKVGSSFEFVVINTNGSGSGVITITTNTGWSIGTSGSQGLMTVTTAGTSQNYRAVKTGDGAWSLYRVG